MVGPRRKQRVGQSCRAVSLAGRRLAAPRLANDGLKRAARGGRVIELERANRRREGVDDGRRGGDGDDAQSAPASEDVRYLGRTHEVPPAVGAGERVDKRAGHAAKERLRRERGEVSRLLLRGLSRG